MSAAKKMKVNTKPEVKKEEKIEKTWRELAAEKLLAEDQAQKEKDEAKAKAKAEKKAKKEAKKAEKKSLDLKAKLAIGGVALTTLGGIAVGILTHKDPEEIQIDLPETEGEEEAEEKENSEEE